MVATNLIHRINFICFILSFEHSIDCYWTDHWFFLLDLLSFNDKATTRVTVTVIDGPDAINQRPTRD